MFSMVFIPDCLFLIIYREIKLKKNDFYKIIVSWKVFKRLKILLNVFYMSEYIFFRIFRTLDFL